MRTANPVECVEVKDGDRFIGYVVRVDVLDTPWWFVYRKMLVGELVFVTSREDRTDALRALGVKTSEER